MIYVVLFTCFVNVFTCKQVFTLLSDITTDVILIFKTPDFASQNLHLSSPSNNYCLMKAIIFFDIVLV